MALLTASERQPISPVYLSYISLVSPSLLSYISQGAMALLTASERQPGLCNFAVVRVRVRVTEGLG